MRCVCQSDDQICETNLGPIPTVSKDPVNLKHLSLDLSVLDVAFLAEQLFLSLSDQLICVFFHYDGALRADNFKRVTLSPVCILDTLCVPGSLEAILKQSDRRW